MSDQQTSTPTDTASDPRPLAARFDTLLFDLDGVVYIGPAAVPYAADVIAAARAIGVACVFVTNNANRPPHVVAEHLVELGIPTAASDVVTSPQAAVSLLPGRVPDGSAVLVVGGPGIDDALAERGYRPVRSRADGPSAVMQGFSPDVSWRDLAEASYAVGAGLPWIATNHDLTIPTPHGIAPGNGALVAVVAQATGRDPDAIAGKPEPPLLHEAVARVGAIRPLMVGDRLDTDIAAGPRAGVPTLLVLTGVTDVAGLLAAAPAERPDYVGADLRVLVDPYPELSVEAGLARCGDVTARVVDGRVEVRGSGPLGQVAHAVAAAVWAATDAGIDVDLAAAAATVAQVATAVR